MASDFDSVTERLAAQPVSEKRIRNQLIDEGYSIREATARAAGVTRRRAGTPRAASQKALGEAVAAAVRTATAARKAAKKAARRATAEAAATRALQERQQLAAQFTEAAVSTSLHEASGSDLAAITAIAMSGTGQPGPAGRQAVEMTIDPQSLSLEDLSLAATAGTAGHSLFWGGSPVGGSPFWRGLQDGGASKGTAHA